MAGMTDESSSTERQQNLWAPWRMEYIDALNEGGAGCFLCRHRDEKDKDQKNLVLWRGKSSFVCLNRFPYTGGHCLVSPCEHLSELHEVPDETMTEMIHFLADLQKLLAHTMRAEGFNVGLNIGRCAGAGLPGHLHLHIVPRWSGDTNFMSVFGGVRVIPQWLETLWAQLRQAGEELKLPRDRP